MANGKSSGVQLLFNRVDGRSALPTDLLLASCHPKYSHQSLQAWMQQCQNAGSPLPGLSFDAGSSIVWGYSPTTWSVFQWRIVDHVDMKTTPGRLAEDFRLLMTDFSRVCFPSRLSTTAPVFQTCSYEPTATCTVKLLGIFSQLWEAFTVETLNQPEGREFACYLALMAGNVHCMRREWVSPSIWQKLREILQMILFDDRFISFFQSPLGRTDPVCVSIHLNARSIWLMALPCLFPTFTECVQSALQASPALASSMLRHLSMCLEVAFTKEQSTDMMQLCAVPASWFDAFWQQALQPSGWFFHLISAHTAKLVASFQQVDTVEPTSFPIIDAQLQLIINLQRILLGNASSGKLLFECERFLRILIDQSMVVLESASQVIDRDSTRRDQINEAMKRSIIGIVWPLWLSFLRHGPSVSSASALSSRMCSSPDSSTPPIIALLRAIEGVRATVEGPTKMADVPADVASKESQSSESETLVVESNHPCTSSFQNTHSKTFRGAVSTLVEFDSQCALGPADSCTVRITSSTGGLIREICMGRFGKNILPVPSDSIMVKGDYIRVELRITVPGGAVSKSKSSRGGYGIKIVVTPVFPSKPSSLHWLTSTSMSLTSLARSVIDELLCPSHSQIVAPWLDASSQVDLAAQNVHAKDAWVMLTNRPNWLPSGLFPSSALDGAIESNPHGMYLEQFVSAPSAIQSLLVLHFCSKVKTPEQYDAYGVSAQLIQRQIISVVWHLCNSVPRVQELERQMSNMTDDQMVTWLASVPEGSPVAVMTKLFKKFVVPCLKEAAQLPRIDIRPNNEVEGKEECESKDDDVVYVSNAVFSFSFNCTSN
jgi:hypothetical protein